MRQEIITDKSLPELVKETAEKRGVSRFMLVCDSAFEMLGTYKEYSGMEHIAARFSNFSPNPLYDEVCEGVKLFKEAGCDGIVAVGGGSSIDTAKCIRAFSKMDAGQLYLSQPFRENDIPFIAAPTTAGTGSESTRYAVVYYEGKKQSVTDETLIPDCAVLDARNLETLPLYQKKCTMLDALCQGIESWWSINATPESRELSEKAVEMIVDNIQAYLSGDRDAAGNMMIAANLAGRAINITQTTAAHAMSYKLTSLYKIPHGRAAFACLPHVWEYMIDHSKEKTELSTVFAAIAAALKCAGPQEGVMYLKKLNQELFEGSGVRVDLGDIPVLAASVNVTRLRNNPVQMDEATLAMLYEKILKEI